VLPSGIVSTGWPAVRDKCAEFGDTFDEWQDGAGRAILAKRADGIYAATVGGITLSIPRQVAKTFLVGRIIFALCALFPGLKVLWTAHRTRTATNTFRSLQGYARRRKVSPYIKHIRTANGEQEIAFRNGSVIMFGAREQGFGRGFDEVDVEVFDEAQILTEKALEDMVAATNQARHPHGALLFFMGTPPRPVDPGEAFTIRRKKALSGKADDLVYIEFSADQDAELDDHAQWAKANPSYPHRTPLESMLRLRENLPSDDGWRREALGIWDLDVISDILPRWPELATSEAPPDPGALGVAADIDQTWLSLGAFGLERPHLGSVLRMRFDQGRKQFVAEVARIALERSLPVVIDKKGPAAEVIPDLEALGVYVLSVGLDDAVQACADLRDAVEAGEVEHGDYPDLNMAVSAATWRKVGDRRLFGRKGGDISMLEAVTLAKFAVASIAPTVW
jgi:hypothetical protein